MLKNEAKSVVFNLKLYGESPFDPINKRWKALSKNIPRGSLFNLKPPSYENISSFERLSAAEPSKRIVKLKRISVHFNHYLRTIFSLFTLKIIKR